MEKENKETKEKFKYQVPFVVTDKEMHDRINVQRKRYGNLSWNMFLNMAARDMVTKMENGKPITEQD
jgi:adenosyl cobinamide kinase/adenosyl cobinamide phosphate guanylyltransferase